MALVFACWLVALLATAGVGVAVRADGGVERRLTALRPPQTIPRMRRSLQDRLAARLAGSPRFAGDRVRRRLLLAGRDPDPAAHLRRNMRGAEVGGLVAVALLLAAPSAPAIVVSPIVVVAGFRAPDLSLARRARSRQAAIARAVPDVLDLLAACVAAGQGARPALMRATAHARGPLGEELAGAMRSVELGRRLGDALADLVERTDVAILRRVVQTLSRTERLGTSLAEALRALARTARAERRALAETAARAAPVKLLFPLVFVILPAFLLLTVVPVLLATVRGLR